MYLFKLLCEIALKSLGWKIDTTNPPLKRCIIIAAPHTSNWDFLMMFLFAGAFGLKINWMAKSSIFKEPFGFILRKMGGIPVDRRQKNELVQDMVALFQSDYMVRLVVPVEGTRAYAQYWKSGFYHIAKEANVPILPTFLDYSEKRGGFGTAVNITGDLKADMQSLRDFYAPYKGKFPALSGPIRLREEKDLNFERK